MKRALLLCCAALTLASCAPRYVGLYDAVNAAAYAQGEKARLVSGGGALSFDNTRASNDAERVSLFMTGAALNAENCTPLDGGLWCKLGTVKAGESATVNYGGTLETANVSFVRAGKRVTLGLDARAP